MKMIKITVILLVLILTAGFLFAQEEAEELEKEKAPGGMTFWQTIKAGGTAMVFIGLCSVLAVAITVERIISMKPAKVMPMGFVNEVSELVKQRKYYEAKGKCDGSLTPVSNVLGAALGEMDNGKEATVAAVEDAGAKEMTELQQKMGYLSIIAVISPMIGLLGTVLGMIQAFNVIAYQAGLGKPTLLAEGISKALITTAAGLIVAIPAMVSYHYLRVKAQNIGSTIEKVSEAFISLIFKPEDKQ